MDRLFSNVGIVGVGLIGGSLGLALKKTGAGAHIMGVGRDRERLRLALEMGAVDEVSMEMAALRGCDLVILATPVEHIIESLRNIGVFLKPGALVTDVGSTKRRICGTAWACLPDGIEFIGGHPVAGREVTGVASSLPDLFRNAPYVLCSRAGDSARNLGRLESLITALEARAITMTPEEHDQAIAWVSHLPQLLSTALANEVSAQRLDISGSGLRDMLRLAGSPYSVWQGILETNCDNIDLALGHLIQRLEDLRARHRDGDLSGEFKNAVETARKIR